MSYSLPVQAHTLIYSANRARAGGAVALSTLVFGSRTPICGVLACSWNSPHPFERAARYWFYMAFVWADKLFEHLSERDIFGILREWVCSTFESLQHSKRTPGAIKLRGFFLLKNVNKLLAY